MRFIVMDEETGKIVRPGDTVTDFRGSTAEFKGASRAREDGRSGMVEVLPTGGSMERSYYDAVFKLYVVAPGELLPCGCPATVVKGSGSHQTGCQFNP